MVVPDISQNTILYPLDWRRTTHVVSMFHSLLVVPIAFRSLDVPALDHDRAFGWDDSVAKLYAISSGCVSLLNFST